MEGKTFLVYDYIKKEWHQGDTLQEEVLDQFDLVERLRDGVNINQLRVPTNCASVYLERELNYTGKLPVVISGGNKHARVSDRVKGISFWQQ